MGMSEEKERAIRLLGRLTQAHGAPGYEDEVRRIFREELSGEIHTDKMGNIACRKKGSAETPVVMLESHMDEVGFVVQAITASGLIKFMPLGSWWAHTLPGLRVRIRTREGVDIVGVVGAKPPHFLESGEREKLQKIENMFIDVGAGSGSEVRESFGIRLGDSIVPESSFVQMHHEDLLMGKAFDDRVGVALTIQSLQLLDGITHPNNVWGVGAVQEEIGTRGAQTAVFDVNPDVAIVLEGPPADDLPDVSDDERQGALGRGVQIRLLDPSAIANRKLARYVVEIAEQMGINHQIAVRKSGSTDARTISLYRSGVPTIVLGVPARYTHTQNGILNIQDYLSALELVMKVVGGLDDARVAGFTAYS
jgi:putative aminopeptidase FrvX